MTDNTIYTRSSDGPQRRALKVVLPGGSGHVGRALARHFYECGDKVCVLSRRTGKAPWRVVQWDGISAAKWVEELEGADLVINLADRSVDCRYTTANRRAIVDSRIAPTILLGNVIGGLSQPPRLWMNASTATIYRNALDCGMDEATGDIGGKEQDTPTSWRFSVEVAACWEEAFFSAQAPRTRKIALRSAMIMDTEPGGVFDKLSRLVRLGLGGALGSGDQYVSWIHEKDFVHAVEHLIGRGDMEGPVNIASPFPLSNRQFMRVLREAWGLRIGLPAPEWMLEIGAAVVRTETELLLKSRRVIPGRLAKTGFRFSFGVWSDAVRDLVERWRQEHSGRRSVDAESSSVRRELSESSVQRIATTEGKL